MFKRDGMLRVAAGLLIGLALPWIGSAQGTREDYERAEKFLPGNLQHSVYVANVVPNWLNKSSRFWYRKVGPAGKEFILVDSAQNSQKPAFDHARLAGALSHASHQEVSATDLPFDTFEFQDHDGAIRFTADEIRWRCTLGDYVCEKSAGPADDITEAFSPDHRWAAYVNHYNLYLRDTSTGQVMQLTRDGEKENDYATPLPSLRTMVEQGTETPRQRPGVFWSPDGTKLITYRIDSRNAARFTSLQFVPPDQLRPKAYSYAYFLPGEPLPMASLTIFDVPSGRRIDVDTAPVSVYYYGGPRLTWFDDSNRFYYLHIERGYKDGQLREVDAQTGKQRAVVSEHSDIRVDEYETLFNFTSDGSQAVWASDRDGWNHLYLYDGATGALEKQLTKGDFVVRALVYTDGKAHQTYFLACGKEAGEDPYQNHLYRVNFDGTGLTLLTPESADHAVVFSPDGQYFVDNFSRADLPGGTSLRRASDGSIVRELEKTDVAALTKMGWKPPTPFAGKADDGKTDIYGLIWRPSNFDASKKYPVVEYVYTGPHNFFVPKKFSACCGTQQQMAELGFVVVMVDGRGTAGRSEEFHNFSYHNLGGSFPDHVALIRQMAAKYPYMDLSRVGIYGTSHGGFGTARAMLTFPDFYKVGVATSGDHDPRLDKASWNEAYEGYPIDNDYLSQSNYTLADKLQGHLLLEHGDVDDNVNPVETMRFVSVLMKDNKNFDMLFVPGMFHGEGNNPYLFRRRWDYFVRYLMGVEPPANFEVKDYEVPSEATSPRARR